MPFRLARTIPLPFVRKKDDYRILHMASNIVRDAEEKVVFIAIAVQKNQVAYVSSAFIIYGAQFPFFQNLYPFQMKDILFETFVDRIFLIVFSVRVGFFYRQIFRIIQHLVSQAGIHVNDSHEYSLHTNFIGHLRNTITSTNSSFYKAEQLLAGLW